MRATCCGLVWISNDQSTTQLVRDEDAAPGQDVLDVPVAEVEAVGKPDRVPDDLGRKPVPPVEACSTLHPGFVRSGRLTWHYPAKTEDWAGRRDSCRSMSDWPSGFA